MAESGVGRGASGELGAGDLVLNAGYDEITPMKRARDWRCRKRLDVFQRVSETCWKKARQVCWRKVKGKEKPGEVVGRRWKAEAGANGKSSSCIGISSNLEEP